MPATQLPPRGGREDGFSLMELVVTMVIASTLMGLGIFGFTNWQSMSEQQGTAQSLVSALRNVAVRSVSESRTYCVDFVAETGKSYVVYRAACGTGTVASGVRQTESTKVSFVTTVPAPATATPTSCPASHKCVYFYPRGTASPASVNVRSTARAKVYTIYVEGLTARVWM